MFEKETIRKSGTNSHPKHIAITLNGMKNWIEANRLDIAEGYRKSLKKIEEVLEFQVAENVNIVTFYILPEQKKKLDETSIFILELIDFFDRLKDSPLVNDKKIKLSVIGKWYDLPSKLIDSIKSMIEKTRDNTNFFVNFCINYNGHEEIVDACKMVGRQIKAERLDPDAITKEIIRENMYSSNLVPPDIIIKNGKHIKTDLFLWDSVNAVEFFSGKLWPEFQKADFLRAIKEYQKEAE